MDTIGDRIRREREEQGMSRAELAKLVGAKGESYISELELGGIKKGGRLHQIAEALGLHVKWLETGKGPKKDGSQPMRPSDETMAQALDLLYMLADLRPDDERFDRITWPMLLVAAKAIERKASQRETVSILLSDLKEISDATG